MISTFHPPVSSFSNTNRFFTLSDNLSIFDFTVVIVASLTLVPLLMWILIGVICELGKPNTSSILA